jgi:hypothetical protein
MPALLILLGLAVAGLALLLPSARAARAERRAAFEDSLTGQFELDPYLEELRADEDSDRVGTDLVPLSEAPPPVAGASRMTPARRRRRIAGGLLVAMLTSLALGLLPPLRMLLPLSLFVLDFFLAYLTLLVHRARRKQETRAAAAAPVAVPAAA